LFCKSADKSFIIASELTTKLTKILILLSLFNSTLDVTSLAVLYSFITTSTKFSIENLVEVVIKEYKTAKEVTSRVELNKDNNINIFVNLVVSSDAIIKDLSADLQNKIKTKIKDATDLEVKEVNIAIKKAIQEKQVNIEKE